MTDLLVLLPPKRSRSRRFRKKLHIGEFRVLGFDYELTWLQKPDALGHRFHGKVTTRSTSN